MTKKCVSSQNGTIYYWTSKNNELATLVFLPGLTADHTLFEQQIMALKNEYNILVWDCPCHGLSRPYTDFTYRNVTVELNRILEVENINEMVLIGQSLGGMIAQYFANEYPHKVKGFIGIDTAPFGSYYSKSDLFWLNQL